MADYLIKGETLSDIADAIRTKKNTNKSIAAGEFAEEIQNIEAGGSDPVLQDKTVTPTTSTQTIIADDGYDGLDTVTVNAMPTTPKARPSITVSSSGLITASSTQSAGYVTSGTTSSTKQLTVQAAQTITPSTSNKTIASGRYLTGTQTIKGDSNLVAGNIKNGVSIFGVTGTHSGGEDLDAVIAEQAELIAELETALENAASGGGGGKSFETCTVIVTVDRSSMLGLIATTVDENGNLGIGYDGSVNSSDSRTSATLTNVLCGSMFDINVSMSVPLAVTSGGAIAVSRADAFYSSLSFIAPNESGAVGTISISDDS